MRVLSLLFRRLFLEQLQAAFDAGQLHFFNALEALQSPDSFARYLAPVRKVKWVVYAKPPFGGPQQVLEYLGRYTHRVAIANQRLIDCVDGKVRFHWKDYRHDSRQKVMTLDVDEFIRRFLLHVLPSGFQRIRGITACLPIAVARLSWLAAGSYSTLPLTPSNSPMPRWTIGTATNSSPVNRCVIARSVVRVT